jgi:hypothetical protein
VKPSQAAYIPTADQTMRGHVRERQTGWAAAARELQATFNASPPETPSPGRRYITADEACADLGLEPEQRKAATAALRSLVSEQASGFSVTKDLRAQGVRVPVIKELLTRGIRMVVEARAAKGVHDLYIRKAKPPPGAGWMPIPRGKRGGFRRPKSGGGFEYAYPDAEGGYTSHDAPAADEHVATHEEHENGTPDPKVRARMEAVEKKAKDAGLAFTGTATARTTIKHVNELEKQLDRAIAQKRKREKEGAQPGDAPAPAPGDVDATPHPGQKPRAKEPTAPSDDGEPSTQGDNRGTGTEEAPGASGESREEPGASPPPKAEPPPRAQRERRIRELAESKGIAPEKLKAVLADPDYQTEEGHDALIQTLEGMPDLVDDLPDTVPENPAERKKLEEHAAKLEETIDRMERALSIERESHKKEIAALRAAVEKLAKQPTPRQAKDATDDLVCAALIIFGFAAGFLFAGPMGALLGGSMANHFIKTGVAKSEPYEPFPLSPGLYVVAGSLLLVKAVAHPSGSGWMSVPGGKKGGYRRPKSGGGYEYWYADAHEAAAHHDEKAASSRETAQRWRDTGAKAGAIAHADERAATHTEAAEAARATGSQKNTASDPGSRERAGEDWTTNEAHRGKRTLGADEGKVWATLADLFAGIHPDESGKVRLEDGTTLGPETVTVRDVSGNLHAIKVTVRAGGEGSQRTGGFLSSRPTPAIDADGRVDRTKTVQKPTEIVVFVPHGESFLSPLLEDARNTLSHELAHAMDNLTGAHQKRDKAKYREHGDAYYNDPTEIVAYRHNIFRELNDPKVAKQVKEFRDTMTDGPEEQAEMRAYHAEMRAEGSQMAGMGYTGAPHLSAVNVVNFLDRHSSTWAQVSPYLTADNRRKMLVTAAAVLDAHHTDTSEPQAKSLAAPAPIVAPRIRGRHGENEHGHRDGLYPGQTLTVRKGAPGPKTVTVLPAGAFQWGDNTYPNGRQLLKALTGSDAPTATIRRYFALGDDNARLAKALAGALHAKHPGLLVSAYGGRVRVEGDLAAHGIQGDSTLDTTALLDVAVVQTLLAEPAP